jgi:hypothetical protein
MSLQETKIASEIHYLIITSYTKGIPADRSKDKPSFFTIAGKAFPFTPVTLNGMIRL